MMIQITQETLDELIALAPSNEEAYDALDADFTPDPIGRHLFMPHTNPRGWDKRLCSYNGCGASPESAVHLG